MAEALNLKPCPFCGETEHLYPTMRHVEAAAPYGIDCVGCGVEFIPREGFDVIEAWNRRSEPEAARPPEALEGLIERLRSNAPLPICPYDKRSPLYWTAPDDKPCEFCGGTPDGPDKCRGADTRVIDQAADALESALRLLGEVEKALEEIARIRTELRGDFSLSSKQSDIARSALDKLRKGMGSSREPSPTTCAAPLASKLADQQRGASGAEEGD